MKKKKKEKKKGQVVTGPFFCFGHLNRPPPIQSKAFWHIRSIDRGKSLFILYVTHNEIGLFCLAAISRRVVDSSLTHLAIVTFIFSF